MKDYYEHYLEIETKTNECIKYMLDNEKKAYRFISNRVLQKQGIDLVTKEGNIDIKAHSYDNDYLVLELYQKSDKGWLYKEDSKTDYIWWCTLARNKITVVDYKKLKDFDHSKYNEIKTKYTGAAFKLIPLEDLKDITFDVFYCDFTKMSPYIKENKI